ncbi:MAG: tetratricopeptide repeat protein [Bacteroidota bacterium]
MDSVKYTFRFREKYLAGQVSAEEKREFESELSRNPQLLEQLKQQIYLGELVGDAMEEESTIVNPPDENTDSTHTESGFKRPTPVIPLPWYREPVKMAAAVAFFLICCVGVWWLSQNSGPDYKMIANAAYQTIPLDEEEIKLANKGIQNPDKVDEVIIPDSVKVQGYRAYDKGKFEEAIEKFSQFMETGRDSSGAATYYRSLAQMETKAYEAAVAGFEDYLKLQPEGKYAEAGKYHEGLALLQTGGIEKATKLFEEIASDGEEYKGRSAGLLEKLKE